VLVRDCCAKVEVLRLFRCPSPNLSKRGRGSKAHVESAQHSLRERTKWAVYDMKYLRVSRVPFTSGEGQVGIALSFRKGQRGVWRSYRESAASTHRGYENTQQRIRGRYHCSAPPFLCGMSMTTRTHDTEPHAPRRLPSTVIPPNQRIPPGLSYVSSHKILFVATRNLHFIRIPSQGLYRRSSCTMGQHRTSPSSRDQPYLGGVGT
jgi:hypothetical protein